MELYFYFCLYLQQIAILSLFCCPWASSTGALADIFINNSNYFQLWVHPIKDTTIEVNDSMVIASQDKMYIKSNEKVDIAKG